MKIHILKGIIMKKLPHTPKKTSKKITSEDLNKVSGGNRGRSVGTDIREALDRMSRNPPPGAPRRRPE